MCLQVTPCLVAICLVLELQDPVMVLACCLQPTPCLAIFCPKLQDPVVVLVKEYLPGSKAVAINELQVRSCCARCA